MDVLIIGGTQFVGRHLAEAALEAGHKVTLFNRGKTGPGLYPQAETLVGDRDGERVAGRPEQGVQVIHARDMADWLLKAVDQKLSGAYNLTGRPVKMNDLLDTVVSLTGKNTTVSYVGDELLKVRDIPPVDGVGYWVPAEAEGIMRANVDKVFAAGYTERPLRQSISETLEWLRREGFQSDNLKERIEGRVLSMEKENEILEAFKQQDN
ncbi:MAG: hypothetical protein IT321_16505 [Anaerolineae bacterium]|nr:hypothetical protein [Anaerolineae bacterium]